MNFAILDVVMGGVVSNVGSHVVRSVSVRQRFTGQHVYASRGERRERLHVGFWMHMAVIVIFEVFKHVADVEKGVAIEPDVDESRLHAGKHAGDAAFVDTADERELFFAFDVNFD